ncbi:hypothetical protein OH76DRAFT_1412183 [Lentinus brumalis]|uniref:Uncharacterized protein n=1 Tax=Lentinus brumalis TaxID=2498619 RepID=A0A371CM28_9APHY|nr:hypothetical protein OH76DRAFT_1412183 [Polyporus brumalis]
MPRVQALPRPRPGRTLVAAGQPRAAAAAPSLLRVHEGAAKRSRTTQHRRHPCTCRCRGSVVLEYPSSSRFRRFYADSEGHDSNPDPEIPAAGSRDAHRRPAHPSGTTAPRCRSGAPRDQKTLGRLHLVFDCVERKDELQWLPHYEKAHSLHDPTTRTAGEPQRRTPPAHRRETHPQAQDPRNQHARASTVPRAPRSLHAHRAPLPARHLARRRPPPLLRLSGLESLTLSFVPVYDQDATARFAPIYGFRRLRAQTIATRAHANGEPAISQTYREPLEHMRARRYAPQHASVSLEIPTRWRTHETMGDLVRPLQDWTTLEHVVVKAQCSEYQVTENDLERWPKLSRISLGWNARVARCLRFGPAAEPARALLHRCVRAPSGAAEGTGCRSCPRRSRIPSETRRWSHDTSSICSRGIPDGL